MKALDSTIAEIRRQSSENFGVLPSQALAKIGPKLVLAAYCQTKVVYEIGSLNSGCRNNQGVSIFGDASLGHTPPSLVLIVVSSKPLPKPKLCEKKYIAQVHL